MAEHSFVKEKHEHKFSEFRCSDQTPGVHYSTLRAQYDEYNGVSFVCDTCGECINMNQLLYAPKET